MTPELQKRIAAQVGKLLVLLSLSLSLVVLVSVLALSLFLFLRLCLFLVNPCKVVWRVYMLLLCFFFHFNFAHYVHCMSLSM